MSDAAAEPQVVVLEQTLWRDLSAADDYTAFGQAWLGLACRMVAAQQTTMETKMVSIDNFTFSAKELTVAVGSTVRWINHDDIPHSIVAGNTAFRSKVLDTDDVYSFTFTSAGTFDYRCGLHPLMTGTIIVK